LSSNVDKLPEEQVGALALTISYHGGAFFGSQRQGGQRTVQRELEQALSELFGTDTPSIFAGRTDRGVHAAGQVVSVPDRRMDLTERQIQRALNARLPEDLAVDMIERKSVWFHARYDALWREYRYRLWVGSRQPLAEWLVARKPGPLCVEAMSRAAEHLVGEHDLASFAGDGEGVPGSERSRAPRGTVRTILKCSVRRAEPWWSGRSEAGELIEIRIAADGFLPKMVRNVVGGLTEIGAKRKEPDWFLALLAGRDRREGGKTAPAHGLTLWRVGYDGDAPEDDCPKPAAGSGID